MNTKKFAVILCLFVLGLVSGTTFESIYDTDTPVGTDAPSVLDDEIREVKDAVQERMNVDHYFATTGSEVSSEFTGEHRQITFYSTITDPTQVDSKAHLYMTDDELVYQDDTNSALTLTDAGTLNITSADLVGTLANDTYFTAVDAAGTGTVSLIKADSSDEVVLGTIGADIDLNSNKLTNVADATADGDALHLGMYDPTAYTGGETSTFPSGLIIKGGVETTGAATLSVTFDTAFPRGIVTVIATPTKGSAAGGEAACVSTKSTTGFTVKLAGSVTGFNWIAIGY